MSDTKKNNKKLLQSDGRVGPPILVSFYDMMQFEDAKAIVQSSDEVAFEDMLWSIGVNVETDSYEITECNHRPKSLEGKGPTKEQEQWYGPCVKGSYRIDDEWINSGHANFETKVAALSDAGMQALLGSMGKQVSVDKAFY